MLLAGGIERWRQIGRFPHIEQMRLHAKGPRRLLYIGPLRRLGTVAHVQERSNARESGNQVAQNLDPLGHQIGDDSAKSRDISARMSEARDDQKRFADWHHYD